ncbi:MAG: hypothetical protein OER88_02445, partial [Planctomycetota bacterium]|nr:hypothetical protein [Planctomycetota bacterium]
PDPPPNKRPDRESTEEFRLNHQLPPDATHTEFDKFNLVPLPDATVAGAGLVVPDELTPAGAETTDLGPEEEPAFEGTTHETLEFDESDFAPPPARDPDSDSDSDSDSEPQPEPPRALGEFDDDVPLGITRTEVFRPDAYAPREPPPAARPPREPDPVVEPDPDSESLEPDVDATATSFDVVPSDAAPDHADPNDAAPDDPAPDPPAAVGEFEDDVPSGATRTEMFRSDAFAPRDAPPVERPQHESDPDSDALEHDIDATATSFDAVPSDAAPDDPAPDPPSAVGEFDDVPQGVTRTEILGNREGRSRAEPSGDGPAAPPTATQYGVDFKIPKDGPRDETDPAPVEPADDATRTAHGFDDDDDATVTQHGLDLDETSVRDATGPDTDTQFGGFDSDETSTRVHDPLFRDLADSDETRGTETPAAHLGTDDANYDSTRTDLFRPVDVETDTPRPAASGPALADAPTQDLSGTPLATPVKTDVPGANAPIDQLETAAVPPPAGARIDCETDSFDDGDLPPEVPPAQSDEVEEVVSVPALRRRRRARRGPTLLERFKAWDLKGRFEDLEWRQRLKAFGQKLKKALVPQRKGPPKRSEIRIERPAEWWRKTLVEIGVLYSIIVPIEIAVNGGGIGAFGVHPHPYWLVVLPMAGARGVVAGLIAAAVASFLYTIGAFQALGEDGAAAVFTYRHMMEPILFFAVGYFAGELHDELELKRRKLQRLIDDVQTRNTRLRQERDVLADANKELEKRIVDDSVQFNNLIVAATRIEKAGRTEVFEIALDLVDEHCGASASVLILLDDGTLDLLCSRGWDDSQVSNRLAAARESEFVFRALKQGEAVNGFHPEETPAEKGPLVVAPLFDSGGVAKALLCLDEIPLSRLNESTVSIFLGIGEWVSATLGRLDGGGKVERVARPSAPIPAGLSDAWLGRPVELGERLRLEVERCTRYGVPTSFLVIQATEWVDTSRDGRDVLDHYVLTHFTGGMRPSDALYAFGYPGCYLLVLSGTTVEGAEIVRKRLSRRIEYSASRAIGSVEIASMAPDAESPDLLSLIERVAERFRRFSSLPLESRCPLDVPEETRSGDIEEFIRRLRLETSLATRNSFDFHVIGISAEYVNETEPALLARHVHAAGIRVLRPTDGVYVIGRQHCAVILPNTDPESAAMVAHRLVTAVRERDADAPYGNLETQVLCLGSNHPDASALLAALARSQRKETQA